MAESLDRRVVRIRFVTRQISFGEREPTSNHRSRGWAPPFQPPYRFPRDQAVARVLGTCEPPRVFPLLPIPRPPPSGPHVLTPYRRPPGARRSRPQKPAVEAQEVSLTSPPSNRKSPRSKKRWARRTFGTIPTTPRRSVPRPPALRKSSNPS